MEKNHKVTMKVNDIYGMLVLLGLGVGVALLAFVAETVMLVRQKHNKYKVSCMIAYYLLLRSSEWVLPVVPKILRYTTEL